MKKAKNARSARFLKNKLPKAKEDAKRALFIRGMKTNETIMSLLKDLNLLKKPQSIMFSIKEVPFILINDLGLFKLLFSNLEPFPAAKTKKFIPLNNFLKIYLLFFDPNFFFLDETLILKYFFLYL